MVQLKSDGTRNTFRGARYLPRCRNMRKTSCPRNIKLKSHNRLLSYWPTIFNMAAVRHVEFVLKIFTFGHMTATDLQICSCMPNFIKNRLIFTARRVCIARLCCDKMSVRLSHAGILSKRLYTSSIFFTFG